MNSKQPEPERSSTPSPFPAIQHCVLPREQLVVAQARSRISRQQLERWLQTLEADPAYESDMQGVFDAREARFLFDAREAAEIGRRVGAKKLKTNTWVVITRTPIETALSLTYGRRVQGDFPFVVCSSEREAKRILGRPVEPHLTSLAQAG